MLLYLPNLKSKACMSCTDFVSGMKRKINVRRKFEEIKMNFESEYISKITVSILLEFGMEDVPPCGMFHRKQWAIYV